MVAVIAKFEVREGEAERFEAEMATLIAAVHTNEPGNSLYLLTRDRKRANLYTVMERYDAMDAFKAHGGSAWFTDSLARLKPLLVGDFSVEVLEIIG